MRKILIIALALIVLSCSETSEVRDFKPQASPEKLIKEGFFQYFDLFKSNTGNFNNYMHHKYRDEIKSSFRINDVIQIPNTKLYVTLYSYSIEGEIIRKYIYLIKDQDLYYTSRQYFSSYAEDPFHNQQFEEGKKLIKKLENWTDSNDDIWWYENTYSF